MTRIITSFEEIDSHYDVLFFDVWGCLHNGIKPYPKAVEALQKYVKKGGKVVLVTNSPRPGYETSKQIDYIGIPRNSWNLIVTSGDAAQHSFFSGDVGTKIFHIGTQDELSFFQEKPELEIFLEVSFVSLDQAQGIVCTGPFDESKDTITDYLPTLEYGVRNDLPLLCANPDLMVYRGNKKVMCAGLIAQKYSELGGDVLLFGKPRKPIYSLALKRVQKYFENLDRERILCVGDGIPTDVKGAIDNNYSCLFVTGGLSIHETGTKEQPEPIMLKNYLDKCGVKPEYAIGHFC